MHPVLASFDRLYTLGRDAIYWGLKCLGSEPGDCVWMPSFHCGVEVQAALDAGFNVDFYSLRRDLSVDEEDLERKLIDRPGVVMIIHYFGFAQPGVRRIADLCDREGTVLFEDCAHSLFSTLSGQPLGSFGLISAFSLHKTLCLCDGGALSINRKRSQNTAGRRLATPPRGHPTFYGYRLQLREYAKAALGPRLKQRVSAMRSKIEKNPENHPNLRRSHDYRGGMSILSRRLASTMDPALIIRRRTDNWRFLHDRLSTFKGYSNVFLLHEGACPLFFPIRVSRRDRLRSELKALNIETRIFGSHAHPRMDTTLYPEAARAREEILCLPIHQYMKNSDLSRLVEAIGPLLDKYSVEN